MLPVLACQRRGQLQSWQHLLGCSLTPVHLPGSGYGESGGAGGFSQRVIDVSNISSVSVTLWVTQVVVQTIQDVVVEVIPHHLVTIVLLVVDMVQTVDKVEQVE